MDRRVSALAAVLTLAMQAAAAGLAPGTAAANAESTTAPALAGATQPHALPQPILSMGQPSKWNPYGVLSGGYRSTGDDRSSATLALGVFRDWIAPVGQGLGPAAELWGRLDGPQSDAGARLYLASPGLLWRVGLDESFRDGGAPAFALGIDMPVRRAGLFTDGGQLRFDWIPARSQVNLGFQMPLGSRWVGHTRPRDIDANLPRAREKSQPAPVSPEVADAVDLVSRSSAWLYLLTCGILWDDTPKIRPNDLDDLRGFVAGLRSRLAATDSLRPGGHSYPQEVVLYHTSVDRLFGLALGASWADAPRRGREVADAAREALFEQVLLPYDRAFGRVKEPDDLSGLTKAAEIQFADWILSHPEYGPAAIRRVQAALRAWLDGLETVRRRVRDESGIDRDLVWLPLQWGLRPEQFDSQEEMDRILERAAGRPFTRGNSAILISGIQFAAELHRQIEQTEDYHVLWIHDFRGRNGAGNPDLLGYFQTRRYLATLTDRVRDYDRTGRLPAFFVFLDRNYYDANDSRLWLDVLERPLDHRLKMGGGKYASWADTIALLQGQLRAAVAGSARLQADAARQGGPEWIRKIVKIHVSVTNPADLTFRSARMLPGLPGVPDAVARDHRKIAFYDITESDPGRGAAMVTGTGIGEHYASPTWEDRALRVRGPAALEMKSAARRLLLSQGFRLEEIPEALREAPPPVAYDARVGELARAGWTASVINLHNETGFGVKEATVACMILYTLAPPGTELWIPDSIWTSTTIAAALTGAALRGCSVLVIAPALANAPSAGFPQMSRTRVVLGILVEYASGLKQEIAAAGGRLRVGLYTRQEPADDVAGRLREVARGYREEALLRELFPFYEHVSETLDSLAVLAEQSGPGGGRYAPDVAARLPKMHRKTQFIGTSDAVRRLAQDPRTFDILLRRLDQAYAALRDPGWDVLTDEEAAASMAAFAGIDGRGPAESRAHRLYYMTVGSVNKDSRSSFLDGETQFVVSGVWGLGTYFDFFLLLGNTQWLDSQEELEQHIPQYSGFQHRLGRFLRRLL